MRSFVAVLLLGLVAFVAVGATQHSSRVYTLGVKPSLPAVTVKPGDRACQGPVRLPRGIAFERVGLIPATFGKPGPELRIDVIDGSRRLGGGTLAAGYPDVDPTLTERLVSVGRIETQAPLQLCVTNVGAAPMAPIGQVGVASPSTAGTLNGKPIATDITFELHGSDRSLLAQLPAIAERASVFRAGWVTPAVYLVLALLVLVGAPLLLAWAIARAD